jgi:hypothetical protein
MMPGAPERRSFDYVRHGTVDLFAALNIATGKVIGQLSAQHRAIGFRDFLDRIDRQTEPGLAIHVICDNLSTRKAPVVHRSSARPPTASPTGTLNTGKTRPSPDGATRPAPCRSFSPSPRSPPLARP